ncbi:MAG: SDR family oxidoreductase [Flavobacteriales bacterium]|nr:SDR family oxidoreductase [Flavobacteriales bacterium]
MKNKLVIVTGASSGIGKACAVEFAQKGADVVLVARSESKLEVVAEQISSYGVQVLSVVADVSQEEDCKKMVDEVLLKFGKIDVLVNNAGISMRAAFSEIDLSVLKKVMGVNFWGTVYCTRYALASILENKGSVVGVSSIAGYKGLPGRTGYSSSKFAMHGFLESLRLENLKNGLHVLIACPGFTASNIRNTALTGDGSSQGETPRDEQKMMQPEEVATYIVDAVVKRKDRLTLTFNGKLTVLLNKFFPKWVDKLVYNHMRKEADAPFK